MPESPQTPEGQNFVAPNEAHPEHDEFGITQLGLDRMDHRALAEMTTMLRQEQAELHIQLQSAKERLLDEQENGPYENGNAIREHYTEMEKALTRNVKQLQAVERAQDVLRKST